MGRAILAACRSEPGIEIGAVVEAKGSSLVGVPASIIEAGAPAGLRVSDDVESVLADFDVLVDFTRPEASLDYLHVCALTRKRAVVGTTGIDAAGVQRIRGLAERTAIVMAPNMSIGVNVCFKLLEVAATAFGDGVDVEVVEAHHRLKVDAPSGTALRMGEVVAHATGRELSDCGVFSRHGIAGPRPSGAIGFATVRAGDIVGDHTVMFAGSGERVEITHRSSSRSNYAAGALRAVRWVMQRDLGLFDMQDVLGLR